MQLKKQAVEAYNIHLESSEQVRDVVSVATEFAEQFDAEVHGGVREQGGSVPPSIGVALSQWSPDQSK